MPLVSLTVQCPVVSGEYLQGLRSEVPGGGKWGGGGGGGGAIPDAVSWLARLVQWSLVSTCRD